MTTRGGSVRNLWHTTGAHTNTVSSPQSQIVEGTTVYIRACDGDYDSRTILACSGWKSGKA